MTLILLLYWVLIILVSVVFGIGFMLMKLQDWHKKRNPPPPQPRYTGPPVPAPRQRESYCRWP